MRISFALLALAALVVLTTASPTSRAGARRAGPGELKNTSVRKRKFPKVPKSKSGGGEDEQEQEEQEQAEQEAEDNVDETLDDISNEAEEAYKEARDEVKSTFDCFPAAATVAVAGELRAMEDLAVGDNVAVGGGVSRVFMFTHAEKEGLFPFVRLTTAGAEAVSLSAGHYIYANGALVKARAVRVGDRLRLAKGGEAAVVGVEETRERGLYNPQTLQGDIVVGGIVASTYTSAVEPRVAHALLAPVRAVYAWLGLSMVGMEKGAGRAEGLLPIGGSLGGEL